MTSLLCRRVLCLVIALGVGAAASFAASPGLARSTLDVIRERGKLLAGVRFDAPPNGYVSPQGEIVGFGPDLARELARHLGVELELVQVTSKNRIPLLQSGQIDADIGTTTPTKTRDEVVDFSYVYVVDPTLILVRKGDSTDPADYFDSERRVGALQGSFYVGLWRQHSPAARILEYQELPELVVALAQGKVDVVPTMRSQAFGILEALGERAEGLAVGEAFFEDVMAIGLRENDSDWRDWVNWALQRLWAEGIYQALYKKHYRMDPPFALGDAGRLQPGVDKIAQERDPW